MGQGVYVGNDVVIGDNVKIQNHALVYEPAWIEEVALDGIAGARDVRVFHAADAAHQRQLFGMTQKLVHRIRRRVHRRVRPTCQKTRNQRNKLRIA